MSAHKNAQPQTTRKFKKNANGQVACLASEVPYRRRVTEERAYVCVTPGRGGYVWIGSDEAGCYTHIPLTTLKRLIASAEAPDARA